MERLKLGDPVKHRAWKTEGTITDVPLDLDYLSRVEVTWDNGEVKEEWLPALMLDFDRVLFDLSKLGGKKRDRKAKRKNASKSKIIRNKR